MTISTLLILAAYRTHVLHEPCVWQSSLWVLCSSVIRASDWCMEGHTFNSCWGLGFFLCPVLVTSWLHHLSYFFAELKIYHFSLFIINWITTQTCNWTKDDNPFLPWQSRCGFFKKSRNGSVYPQRISDTVFLWNKRTFSLWASRFTPGKHQKCFSLCL